MSHDRCVECGNLVYPEDDPECYEAGDCCCEPCRDRISASAEMDKFLDDPRRR